MRFTLVILALSAIIATLSGANASPPLRGNLKDGGSGGVDQAAYPPAPATTDEKGIVTPPSPTTTIPTPPTPPSSLATPTTPVQAPRTVPNKSARTDTQGETHVPETEGSGKGPSVGDNQTSDKGQNSSDDNQTSVEGDGQVSGGSSGNPKPEQNQDSETGGSGDSSESDSAGGSAGGGASGGNPNGGAGVGGAGGGGAGGDSGAEQKPSTTTTKAPAQDEAVTASTEATVSSETTASAPTLPPADPLGECGTSFVMWFPDNVPVATVPCGGYTAIYTPSGNGGAQPAPKYITGTIDTLAVEDGKLKVNGFDFVNLSEDQNKPTDTSATGGDGESAEEEEVARKKSRKGRSLSGEGESTATTATASVTETTIPVTDLFSFSIKGGKKITVGAPKTTDKAKRDRYELSTDSKVFYSGSGSGNQQGKFSLNSNGDLVDSAGNVVLKDTTSSSSKIKFTIPSVFALLATFLMI